MANAAIAIAVTVRIKGYSPLNPSLDVCFIKMPVYAPDQGKQVCWITTAECPRESDQYAYHENNCCPCHLAYAPTRPTDGDKEGSDVCNGLLR